MRGAACRWCFLAVFTVIDDGPVAALDICSTSSQRDFTEASGDFEENQGLLLVRKVNPVLCRVLFLLLLRLFLTKKPETWLGFILRGTRLEFRGEKIPETLSKPSDLSTANVLANLLAFLLTCWAKLQIITQTAQVDEVVFEKLLPPSDSRRVVKRWLAEKAVSKENAGAFSLFFV